MGGAAVGMANSTPAIKRTAAIAGAAGAALAVGLSVWPPAIPVAGVVGLALFGVAGSNFLRDRGFPASLTRRFAPVVGGLAYLACVLWLDAWTAVGVSAAMTVLIGVLRFGFRGWLRGVRGTHSAQAWAELTYPIAGTLSLAVGWGILGHRWLAFTPIAFMAFGDTAAGLARDATSTDRAPTMLSMSAMLVVCLIAAAIVFRPVWIGAIGAVVATLAERFRPGVLGWWDDNTYIVAASLAVLATLLAVTA